MPIILFREVYALVVKVVIGDKWQINNYYSNNIDKTDKNM